MLSLRHIKGNFQGGKFRGSTSVATLRFKFLLNSWVSSEHGNPIKK